MKSAVIGKKTCIVLLLAMFLMNCFPSVSAVADKTKKETDMEITSEAVVLMEGSTGAIIYEKKSDEQMKPASITKIMTLLLIFDEIAGNNLSLTDQISVSAHASSMGGSQVFLEEGETQDAETLIKCISIASANDASVAMAEFIAGSEEAFVKRMNERASGLGMKNTNFVNCYGLDTDNHYTSARDVALMSRELIMKYPEISRYSTVWMDTFVHTTRKGQTEFGLTNTNKLIKSYQGITGLKTGSTGLAKYCLSATARRNEMDLIAVVMAAPDTKTRFSEAAKLLNYGFANCVIYSDSGVGLDIPKIPITGGFEEFVEIVPDGTFRYVCLTGVEPSAITREVKVSEGTKAPLEQGMLLGTITYSYQNKPIGTLNLIAAKDIPKAGYGEYFIRTIQEYLK